MARFIASPLSTLVNSCNATRGPRDVLSHAAVAICFTAAFSAPVYAQLAESATDYGRLEEVTIIGSRADARLLAGTGGVIDAEQIRIEAATDINQLLKTLPGLYIREEDGFGLRPNIGIRGATSERSANITLMEDGVLIAPAPYAAPAAYYFPTAMRMQGIEVLKGASLLRYGPQTTGGVINLLSASLPEDASGQLRLAYGEYGQTDLLASYGVRSGEFAALVETAQRSADGFKRIDRSNASTGYDIQDYVVKLGWERDSQSVVFKAQYSEELSDETYLGLTDSDFSADANRRYGLSLLDQMDNRHTGLNLSYQRDINEAVALSITAYRNEFARDWFKLSDGDDLVNAANLGDLQAQAVLDGSADFAGLQMKHNNRNYLSQGVQANVDWALNGHQLALGARVHRDTVDFDQPVEVFDQLDGQLLYRRTIAPINGDLRHDEADALSLWLVDSWSASERLMVDVALRYETVNTISLRYGDTARDTVSGRRNNSTGEWLPGIAVRYDLSESWQLIAGVHRGFSPLGAGAQSYEAPETSINWEAGVRYDTGLFMELVGFYSDFSNKAENCSNANPCSNGATVGNFSTGEAVIAGFEFQLSQSFEVAGAQVPTTLMYTYTRAQVSADDPVSGVQSGDLLAAVPRNTLSLRTGIETAMGWDNYAVVKFTDAFCTNIGCNRSASPFEETESLWVIDLISHYTLSEGVDLFLKLENAADTQRIISRQPDGARPNRPRTATLGVEWLF